MKRPFRYAYAEIRTQVVVICGPTRYQLDHGGAPGVIDERSTFSYFRVTLSLGSLWNICNVEAI